jgi:monofunctional biosynthetic peptidoglycan transglycosylase
VQQWVPYGRISETLKRAVLVAEDAAFWQHDGVDYGELRISVRTSLERGEFPRGASTITQQLAKNLYLSPSRNPVRKLRELLIARRLESELSKARIFEIYLNVIEWGDGLFGIEAASRTYFGTSAASLGRSQSALLAAAIVNPRVLNPARPTARLRARQELILRRMGGDANDPAPPPSVKPVDLPSPSAPDPLDQPSSISPDVDPAGPSPEAAELVPEAADPPADVTPNG